MNNQQPNSEKRGMMNRRSFLKLSGLLGLGMASSTLIPSTAEAVKFNRRMFKVSKTRLAMGTFVSLTLVHPSRDEASHAMGLAFEEIDRLVRSMSRFDEATAVGVLNREGRLKDVPPEMARVVSRGLDYYRMTNGVFDISVKPIIDLYREKFAGGSKIPPSEADLEKALKLVGSHRIELRGRSLQFQRPGMGITLDGIAKGYIVDRASEVLSKKGIKNYLVNAGGDIRTAGVRSDKKAWTIAIQDPKKKRQYPDIVHLGNGAIATSGDYEVYFDREKMFHHIVDPRTGRSPRLATSVSVRARTAMDADALSTSVFVMTPDGGTRFINSLSSCECLVIDKKGRMFRSSGWKGQAT